MAIRPRLPGAVAQGSPWGPTWAVPLLVLALTLLAGCGGRETPTPTRTPIPTYTPTPTGASSVPQAVAVDVPATAGAPPTPRPSDTPTPAVPTDTPTPVPTATSTPTPTPSATPTSPPTPSPTPTPDYPFGLEAAERFPSPITTVDEVRIYAYIYGEDALALEGYTLQVIKDGRSLEVLGRSSGGLPGETRPGPSPYTRFANLGLAFFEPPEGEWVVQLVDGAGNPMGPPARFVLEADDPRRELYVRYRRK